jgi:hypothetical protein
LRETDGGGVHDGDGRGGGIRRFSIPGSSTRSNGRGATDVGREGQASNAAAFGPPALSLRHGSSSLPPLTLGGDGSTPGCYGLPMPMASSLPPLVGSAVLGGGDAGGRGGGGAPTTIATTSNAMKAIGTSMDPFSMPPTLHTTPIGSSKSRKRRSMGDAALPSNLPPLRFLPPTSVHHTPYSHTPHTNAQPMPLVHASMHDVHNESMVVDADVDM